LIEEDDFNIENAKELSSKEMMTSYGKIYTLDNVSFSFSGYKDGQKIRVWYDKILVSHPARIKVLKAEKILRVVRIIPNVLCF
jgi:hypothetical protein